MLRTDLKTDECPYCQAKLNAASHVSQEVRPQVGDLSICAYCNRMLEFGPGLVLMKADAASRKAVNGEQLRITKEFLETHKL